MASSLHLDRERGEYLGPLTEIRLLEAKTRDLFSSPEPGLVQAQ